MKKFLIAAMITAILVLPFGLHIGFAADHEETGVAITVTGVNYCLLCNLAEDEVAGADADYAKLNGLKVREAVNADGESVEELKGKTLHYLATKDGKELLTGDANRDKVIVVEGTLYKNANALAVKSFEIADGEVAEGDDDWGWDDWDDLPVGSMSGQPVL